MNIVIIIITLYDNNHDNLQLTTVYILSNFFQVNHTAGINITCKQNLVLTKNIARFLSNRIAPST